MRILKVLFSIVSFLALPFLIWFLVVGTFYADCKHDSYYMKRLKELLTGKITFWEY
jgi:hypothetical protein